MIILIAPTVSKSMVSICGTNNASLGYSVLRPTIEGILIQSRTKSERCSRKRSESFSNRDKDMEKETKQLEKETIKKAGFWKRIFSKLFFDESTEKNINELMTYFVSIEKKMEAGSPVFYPPDEDIDIYKEMIKRNLIVPSPAGSGYMLRNGYEKIWGGDVVKKIIERSNDENLPKL